MSIPQTLKVLGEKEFKDPDVLFVRKCASCGHVFFIRSVDEEHCTKCGSADTVIQTIPYDRTPR